MLPAAWLVLRLAHLYRNVKNQSGTTQSGQLGGETTQSGQLGGETTQRIGTTLKVGTTQRQNYNPKEF